VVVPSQIEGQPRHRARWVETRNNRNKGSWNLFALWRRLRRRGHMECARQSPQRSEGRRRRLGSKAYRGVDMIDASKHMPSAFREHCANRSACLCADTRQSGVAVAALHGVACGGAGTGQRHGPWPVPPGFTGRARDAGPRQGHGFSRGRADASRLPPPSLEHGSPCFSNSGLQPPGRRVGWVPRLDALHPMPNQPARAGRKAQAIFARSTLEACSWETAAGGRSMAPDHHD
jgi:hypothetical protein